MYKNPSNFLQYQNCNTVTYPEGGGGGVSDCKVPQKISVTKRGRPKVCQRKINIDDIYDTGKGYFVFIARCDLYLIRSFTYAILNIERDFSEQINLDSVNEHLGMVPCVVWYWFVVLKQETHLRLSHCMRYLRSLGILTPIHTYY